MNNSFLSEDEIKKLNLKSYGQNILISRFAQIYGEENISIGDNVRIDDFCILSGNINIGNYVHIAAGVYMYGGNAGIQMGDFSTISSHSSIYAISDDYSGNFMTNPMISNEFRNVESKEVLIGRHVIIGASSVILPGSVIDEGVAIGSMSLVKERCEAWTMYAGIPIKKVKKRERKALEMGNRFSMGGGTKTNKIY